MLTFGARRRGIVAVLALSTLLLAGAALRTTSAAWSDQAAFSATATAGTWITPPPATCSVLKVNAGDQTKKTCALTALTAGAVATDGAGVRTVSLTFTFTSPTANVNPNESVVFSVNLTSATPALPGNWQWAQSRVGGSSLTVAPNPATCGPLPAVTARAPGPASGSTWQVTAWLTENANAAGALRCGY